MPAFEKIFIIIELLERIPVLPAEHFNPDIDIGWLGVPIQINPAAVRPENIVNKVHTLAYANQINPEMPSPAAEERKSIFAILLQRTGRERLVEFVHNKCQLRLVLRAVACLQRCQVIA